VTELRLGVVGAGGIARAEHLPRFRRIEGVRIAGVANRTPESSAAVAEAEGIPRAYDAWTDLVADPSLDAVLVAAWPNLHAPVTIAALDAGKHVLTEARMSATLDEAHAMLAAAGAHPDRVAMVVPGSFSLWADRTIRRLIDEQVVGSIRHVRIRWDASGSVAPTEYWRWQRAASGVNVMALGILAEALERWLGPAGWVQSAGRILQPRKPSRDGEVDTDVFDHLLVTAGYEGDVTATVEMSIVTSREGTRIELVGDGGTIEVDLAGQAIVLRESEGGPRTVTIAPEDRLGWSAEVDFVASIRHGRPVELTDFATGVRYMAFVDAVDRAARTGTRVDISSGPSTAS
jgi:predicted dehydrogenase